MHVYIYVHGLDECMSISMCNGNEINEYISTFMDLNGMDLIEMGWMGMDWMGMNWMGMDWMGMD